ncbi:hypothetical protein [Salinibacter altiplanensis]|uniref:hypothetical protein n=1 Tax=Salinibacter altiplanensis TaxID=1803181 RepID=UPI000C9F5CC1|nr:hypothetical protein [Salinibacter altiplanensis]
MPGAARRVGASPPVHDPPRLRGHGDGRHGARGAAHRERPPLFGRIRAAYRPADPERDRRALWDLGLSVALGLVPLLSFGRTFGVYGGTADAPRYHLVYLLPALAAEALYAWLLVQAVGG